MKIGRRLAISAVLGAGVLGTTWRAAPAFGQGAETIRLALQEGGTASWEIVAMQAAGLDAAHGIALDLRAVADSRAGQVALQAGAVDVILSDFVWVSSQRDQGADFTFVPHSLAAGGLMVPPQGPIKSVADLAGQRLAVAGGPVDKSYLILQACFNARTGSLLPDVTSVEFGAPPLVAEMLLGGQVQAMLNYWHFNVRAGLAGMHQLISVRDMLAELGVSRTPPLLGWTFGEATAQAKPAAVQRFLDASFATKALLLNDDAIWTTLRPAMRGAEADDALFEALRDAYRAGIVTSYGAADVQAAHETFAILAKFGESAGIGSRPELAQGTFWAGYSR